MQLRAHISWAAFCRLLSKFDQRFSDQSNEDSFKHSMEKQMLPAGAVGTVLLILFILAAKLPLFINEVGRTDQHFNWSLSDPRSQCFFIYALVLMLAVVCAFWVSLKLLFGRMLLWSSEILFLGVTGCILIMLPFANELIIARVWNRHAEEIWEQDAKDEIMPVDVVAPFVAISYVCLKMSCRTHVLWFLTICAPLPFSILSIAVKSPQLRLRFALVSLSILFHCCLCFSTAFGKEQQLRWAWIGSHDIESDSGVLIESPSKKLTDTQQHNMPLKAGNKLPALVKQDELLVVLPGEYEDPPSMSTSSYSSCTPCKRPSATSSRIHKEVESVTQDDIPLPGICLTDSMSLGKQFCNVADQQCGGGGESPCLYEQREGGLLRATSEKMSCPPARTQSCNALDQNSNGGSAILLPSHSGASLGRRAGNIMAKKQGGGDWRFDDSFPPQPSSMTAFHANSCLNIMETTQGGRSGHRSSTFSLFSGSSKRPSVADSKSSSHRPSVASSSSKRPSVADSKRPSVADSKRPSVADSLFSSSSKRPSVADSKRSSSARSPVSQLGESLSLTMSQSTPSQTPMLEDASTQTETAMTMNVDVQTSTAPSADVAVQTSLVWQQNSFRCKNCARPPKLPGTPPICQTPPRRGRSGRRRLHEAESSSDDLAQSPKSLCSASSGRPASNLVETSMQGRAKSLGVAMKRWVVQPSNGCCPWHEAVDALLDMAHVLQEDTKCKPDYAPLSGWQSRSCTVICTASVKKCVVCGHQRQDDNAGNSSIPAS